MNPFRVSHKTQGIRPQNSCLSEPTSGVCLQNTYDYSAFGVSLDGRTMESDFYRRGFNGMEKDDEFKGKGNSYTTEFRHLDPRLGRWMTIDPLIARFPWQSSYTTFDNNPILLIDPSGLASETTDGEPEKTEPNSPEPKYQREVIVKTVSSNTKAQKVWNRVWGGVNAFFGGMEASIGSALISSGLGAPLGFVLLMHGADHVAAGIYQMATGRKTNSISYNGLKEVAKSAGASEQMAKTIAEFGDASISMVGVGLAASVTRSLERAAPKIAITVTDGQVQITRHAAERMVERGVTEKMVETGIVNGTKYLDPKNGTYNYILKNGFASGKDLLIGMSPETGRVTTVIKGNNLINKRFIQQ